MRGSCQLKESPIALISMASDMHNVLTALYQRPHPNDPLVRYPRKDIPLNFDSPLDRSISAVAVLLLFHPNKLTFILEPVAAINNDGKHTL
jgi:hypothetical protein